MTTAASAPLRIDLSGGYTDVRQIYESLGGVALNVAIDYRTQVFVAESGDRERCAGLPFRLVHSDHRSASFAARLLFRANRILGRDHRQVVAVHNDGPIGCGLGSSASMAVAVVALLAPDLSARDIVEVAYRAEIESGNECGMQDEVAAVYGGASALEFPPTGRYSRSPIDLGQPSTIEQHGTLWLAEAARSSGSTVQEVLAKVRAGDRSTVAALSRLNDIFARLRISLLEGDVVELISGVREVHRAQVALQLGIVPNRVQRLVGTIERCLEGAAKLQGGGGPGAAILVLLPGASRPELAPLMLAYGYRPLRLRFEGRGIMTHDDYLSAGV